MVLLIFNNMQMFGQSEKTWADLLPIREDGCAYQTASLMIRPPFFERSEP
jgi:hypothetical protein